MFQFQTQMARDASGADILGGFGFPSTENFEFFSIFSSTSNLSAFASASTPFSAGRTLYGVPILSQPGISNFFYFFSAHRQPALTF